MMFEIGCQINIAISMVIILLIKIKKRILSLILYWRILVSHIEGETQAEGVQNMGAEGDIQPYEARGKRGLEEPA